MVLIPGFSTALSSEIVSKKLPYLSKSQLLDAEI